MKETLTHQEAFDYYYSIGKKRSFKLVERKFKVSNMSVARWSKAFNWQKRVEQRDIENAKSLEKKTNRIVVNSKADYRNEIKSQIGILKALLNKVIKDIKNGAGFNISNVKELNDIMSSYDKLSKLDLLMMGENPEENKIKVSFELVSTDKNSEDSKNPEEEDK